MRTTRKGFCVSVCEVKHKQCPNVHKFKSVYKDVVFMQYRDEGSIKLQEVFSI